MPSPESTITLEDYRVRYEDERPLEAYKEVNIDLTTDLTDTYEDGVKQFGDQTGKLYASIELGDIDKGGSMLGIFGIDRGFSQKTFVGVETDGKGKVVWLEELKPMEFVQGKRKKYALLLGPKSDELVFSNSQHRQSVKVSGYTLPVPS